MALTATSSSGSQTSTQSPQQAPTGAGSLTAPGQQASTVQPGTPEAALNSQNGITLANTPLHTIGLPATTGTVAVSTPNQPAHHTSPALAGISVILFLVALVLFWSASRPVKNTSDS